MSTERLYSHSERSGKIVANDLDIRSLRLGDICGIERAYER